MKIPIAKAVALFVALGFENAAKWEPDRFNLKFVKMAAVIDDPEQIDPSVIEDKEIRKTFDVVAKALRAKEKVEVEVAKAKASALADEGDEGEPAKAKPAAKPAKPAAKPAKPASKAKPAPQAASKVEKDAFGSRLGSAAAKIHKVLSKKPRTTDEIVKASGVLKATVQEHLWKLRAIDKVIDRNEKGWFLK